MFVLVLDTSTPAVTAALASVSAAEVPPSRSTAAAEVPPSRSTAAAEVPPSSAAADGVVSPAMAGVRVLAERVTVDARAHGELLAPAIHAVLGEAGLTPPDLAAIVAGCGPGPFTGLRVGLVTAAAMGQALAIPTYGVCSLDGIGALTQGTVLVATDARRKEVYWAVYQDGMRVTQPAVNRPGDLSALLAIAVPATAASGGVTAAVGDGAQLYQEALGLPVPADPRFPRPAAMAAAAAARVRARAATEILKPLYLRRPDAVEPGAPKRVRQ